MLPDIRAVIAAMVAATGLMIVAFAAVAAFRVAQETRVASLQADLARAHTTKPEPRPVMVIDTPGPTLLAKAPAEPAAPAPVDTPPASSEPARVEPAGESEDAAARVAAPAVLDSPSITEALADPAPDLPPPATNSAPALDLLTANEPATDPPPAPATVATAPQDAAPHDMEAHPARPSPHSPVLAMGGPSPEEIAQAKARHKLAERARARRAAAEAKRAAAEARKVAAEKARKLRAARLARQRKLAAKRAAEARAKQQVQQQQQRNSFGTTGTFNSAPFGNTYGFGGAMNQPQAQRPAVR